MDAVVSDVTDIDQVIARKRVLSTGHPLLHVGRRADIIHDWIQAETNIRQSSLCISRWRNFPVRECTLAGRGCRTVAAIHGRASAKSGKRIESTVKACYPRCRLRVADVGTLTVVVWHEKDAISGTHHQLVKEPIRRADSGGKVLVLCIVESTVSPAVEHELARIVCAYQGTDRIYGVEVEIFLRVRPFRRGGLDFVSQTEIDCESRIDLPVILQVPAEQVLVGRGEFVITGLIGTAAYTQQEGRKAVARSDRRILRIRSSGRRGLELQNGVRVVAAVDSGPNIHESK